MKKRILIFTLPVLAMMLNSCASDKPATSTTTTTTTHQRVPTLPPETSHQGMTHGMGD